MTASFKRLIPLSLLIMPAGAWAQGILIVPDPNVVIRLPRHVPTPPTPAPGAYAIKSLDYQAAIVDQVARVQVAQTFRNVGGTQMEVCFVFPLPYDGAVERMTLMVDGKELPAQLLKAEEARRIYEEIVRKNRDPALLEWLGAGMFKTSVFPVPAGAERTVSLRYSQLLRKDHGITDFLIPLSTARYTAEAPENVRIQLSIEASSPIKNIYSPTHTIDIQRPDDKHAVVKFSASRQVPGGDFRMFYDCGTGTMGASVLTYRPSEGEDGYFLLLMSPEVKPGHAERPAKTCVFVVDRSGSMSGAKIEQAKGALKFVLNNLREGDLFNVIAYDSEVTSFRPELQRFSEETRKAALGFVEGIYAGGSTNIDAALRAAFAQLVDDKRPSYVIFLTDGLPTVGEQNEMKIVENARAANKVRARLFDFGVGYDVNARLLDRLAREGFGQSEYVKPEESIEAHISRLYNRIGAPALSHVSLAYAFDAPRAEEGQIINRTYPKDVYDIFEGEQLVIVGRYRRAGAARVTVTGRIGDEQRTFDFPATLSGRTADDTYGFIEKLWAVRRIGEIIDELDLKGRNEELIRELVALSTKHGVLTPYTSFLADERTNIYALHDNAVRARRSLGAMDSFSGSGGVAQRAAKGAYQTARSAPAAGRVEFQDLDGRQQEAATVQNLGNKTFYCRKQQWIDSTVTPEMEKNAQPLVQFSDEYFKLAAKYGRSMAQYLAFDEPVVVNIAGQCYRIEPAK